VAWRARLFGHAGAPESAKAIAVVEIENLTQDASLDWLNNGVVELLSTNLAQAKSLQVISSERVRGLIRERVKGEGKLPAGQAQEVAQAAHADMFVSGALLKVGEGLRLDLRVQETATGKVILADKVEAANAQAVFGMVDQATAGILAQLAPGESAARPNIAAMLTSNIEALHAYEEGNSFFDRALTDQAVQSYRRAIALDPQFVMAHVRLAEALAPDDFPAARVEMGKAAELAERLPIPRQQKLRIQGERLQFDGRQEEAIQVYETLVREFPHEVEPHISLGLALQATERNAESISNLEEAVRLDPKAASPYVILGYSYGFGGDLPKALEAMDKYVSFLPPNDPNPIDSRGDVFFYNGKLDEALAQYRKNLELSAKLTGTVFRETAMKVALVYLFQGKYSLAETSLESVRLKGSPGERALATEVLGDIEIGRGALDRAAARFEESARLFGGTPRAIWAAWPLVNAAGVYLAQGRADAALALGKRTTGPRAAEVRAIAYLAMNNSSAAEKEFAAARTELTPFLGEYAAAQGIECDRVLADAWAGKWQEVLARWPRLSPAFRYDSIWAAGRASEETGAVQDAERYLSDAIARMRDWSEISRISRKSFLTYVLAQFYLGKVYEKEGKKTEAINAYQEFLNHFENSTARLPQIAEARAALKRLM
jgi:tetratricopeptide (TPR) repeat protein